MADNTSKTRIDADPPPAPIAGSGSALFVINLCASIAPVPISGKNLPGLENYRLYQVARVEDGRTRHRLRLGFFTSESHAENVLAVVRQQYPTAFTSSLGDEDRRFTRGYLPGSSRAGESPMRPVAVVTKPVAIAPTAPQLPTPSPQKPLTATTPAPAKAPAGDAPATKAAASEVVEISWEPTAASTLGATPVRDAKPKGPSSPAKPAQQTASDTSATVRRPALSPTLKTQPAATPARTEGAPTRSASTAAQAPAPRIDVGASLRIKAPDFTLSDPPAPLAAKPASNTNQPFHVGKGVHVGDLNLTLQTEAPAKPAPATTAAKPVVRPPAASKSQGLTPQTAGGVRTQTLPVSHAPSAGLIRDVGLTDLDSTQTIRALTVAELDDDTQEKWFAIQLAASEQPANLDTMPHLDIFEAYQLYSVATTGSGKIVHSLRLGFFKEAVSAEAVAGYLKTFFGAPSVLRISVAEQTRFKDAPAPKKTAAVAETRSSARVLELSDARAARPTVPTVTMEVPTPRNEATGSFRMNSTGSFKAASTGAHKTFTPQLAPTAKASAPAGRRPEPLARKNGVSGKYRVPLKRSLSEQLLDEAREVELSESGVRKLPKNNSLLSKLVDKLTK